MRGRDLAHEADLGPKKIVVANAIVVNAIIAIGQGKVPS
jgi:hypothetical protein